MKHLRDYEILRQILKEVEVPHVGDYDLDLVYVPPDIKETLPLPHSIFLTILLGTDCKFIPRPHEKTAWAITLRFKGIPMRLEHGKFGMRLASSTPIQHGPVDELAKTLSKASSVTDRLVQPMVQEQIREANVAVPNMFYNLDGRYRFFRKRAERAYSTKPALVKRFGEQIARSFGSDKAKRGFTFDIAKTEREGFYYGSASIDAYYSRLEHLLVLTLPFVNFDPVKDNLLEFMGRNWTEKMKRVFNLALDPDAQRLYDRLREVKERYRNPLSHGGFEREGASFIVHLPNVGGVPARLSRFGESIHYDLFPVMEVSFREACDVFDAVDQHFQQGSVRFGYRWAKSGLLVGFDRESIRKYRDAMVTDQAFDALVERASYETDIATNMDW